MAGGWPYVPDRELPSDVPSLAARCASSLMPDVLVAATLALALKLLRAAFRGSERSLTASLGTTPCLVATPAGAKPRMCIDCESKIN